ncbi:uncharacterized protein LACBIDRAFT_302694 [Laccaria bicolor S238N-H82]|uniref:mRNA 3'-end-processing protein RNA14 n=1 Tax=Laccaria bicolor (strain S238N-H82 / ATCC MYA-4686) TaxID=486041 RepID=B0E436_LACBS|nr:uncharacterized protein LACBIDRAFT_302694 [Laccaria bicolor S238N-H82]EDQ98396.1 predicted protein [Laccaria bicolor S238N-H82]|eukprot:XP_001890954.1 predicted protein [Laccaria bicolor S238N-H82]
MDALRKVYHSAVQIPLDNVERLWQELEAFEVNLNRITAKKFMANLSPAHMQARTVLRHHALYPLSSNVIFLPPLPRFDASERTLVGKWKAYLKWEESNPLEIEEKEKAMLFTRIQGVYRKAVIRMRYYSEIWFMAYTWTNSVGNYRLTFAYAEALALKKDFAEVHTLYDKFLETLRGQLEALEQSSAAANTSLSNGSGTINGNTAAAALPASTSSAITEAGMYSNNTSFSSQASEEKPPKSTEVQERRIEYGLAYIMYIRFARRAEALMEHHCSDDKSVTSRIFETGLNTFGDEIEFVIRYLGS